MNERHEPARDAFYEAVAVKGIGVEETLKGVTKLVFKSLSVKYGEGSGPFPPVSAARSGRAPAPPRLPGPATAPRLPGAPQGRHRHHPSRTPAGPPVPRAAEDLLEELDLEPTADFEEPAAGRGEQAPQHSRDPPGKPRICASASACRPISK